MVRIGIDASGGDNGELQVIIAVINALKQNNDIEFTILGVESLIKATFDKLSYDYKIDRIKIINATEKIEMNDHPVFALRSKNNSSIFIAGQLLKNNEIDIFISAGNTGALVALAQFYLKPLKGIDRPVIGSIIPTMKNPMVLIDSGCNVDSKPEWLKQYALLANCYAKIMLNIEKPRIGLLSVGTEENKGNELTLSAYKLLKDDNNLNFIGNIEARDVPFGVCDILITDGFAGNVFLKTYEGTAKLLIDVLKSMLKKNIVTKIAALLLKTHIKDVFKKYDAKVYGGAPILGANYFIIKCHGNASNIDYEIASMQAYRLVKNRINESIKNSIEVEYE